MKNKVEDIFGLFTKIDEENAKYKDIEKWDKDLVRDTSAEILELTSDLDEFLSTNTETPTTDEESEEKFASWLAIIAVLNMVIHGQKYLDNIKNELKGTPAEQLIDNEIFQLESCFTFYYDYKNYLSEKQIYQIYQKSSELVDEYLKTIESIYDIDSESILDFIENNKLRDGDPILFYQFCKKIYERFLLRI